MILPPLPHGASRLARQSAEPATLVLAQLETAARAVAGDKPADQVKLNYYVVGLNHEKLVTLREARDRVINRPPASTQAGVQALFCDDVQVDI
jgi:enamine deaminase RidA (YjgF/YER057c/UK114 family)